MGRRAGARRLVAAGLLAAALSDAHTAALWCTFYQQENGVPYGTAITPERWRNFFCGDEPLPPEHLHLGVQLNCQYAETEDTPEGVRCRGEERIEYGR